MINRLTSGMAKRISMALRTLAVGAALWVAAMPTSVHAQTAVVEGSVSAFDVVNDSGQAVHGFEIRLEGAVQGDLYYTMFGQRYGNPKVVPDTTGVSIRYESPYDNVSHSYTVTTPQHDPGTPFSWNDCYSAGARYSVSGCEHFGQSLRNTTNITKISGYWLVESTTNPGTLVRLLPPAAIPFPTWTLGAVITTSPVVVAQVEAPEPPETPEVYGDAQWVKIFKTELPRQVVADELSSTNPAVVPEDPTQAEVSWDILQASPPAGGNGNRNRGQKQNQGSIAPTTRSVIRRYELYKYAGTYDPLTHEAICADAGLCKNPAVGEVGVALSAQNTAANVTPDVLVLTLTGNGTVTGTNGINCGNTCVAFGISGSAVVLTATPGSQVFAGWSGSCTGTALTCSVTVSGVTNVGAAFNPPPNSTATVVVNGSGEVRSSVGSIRCPGICSATLATGTVVTFTAKGIKDTFTGWSGACSGTALNCTVTLTGDTNVVANFAPPAGGGGAVGGGGTTTSTFKVSISKNGKGTVTANPSAASYAAGTLVTLTATPDPGSPWVGWGGACSGTQPTCTVTMNANLSVVANFK